MSKGVICIIPIFAGRVSVLRQLLDNNAENEFLAAKHAEGINFVDLQTIFTVYSLMRSIE